MCNMHYQRWVRHGDTSVTRKYFDPVAAFWSRTNKEGPEHPTLGKCWDWTGSLVGLQGYGGLAVNGVQAKAHRFSWELHFGVIPDGLHVLHRCDRPRCVNPSHLFLGTHQDNMDDKMSKGRHVVLKGSRNPIAKLSEEQVLEIKRRYRGRCRRNGAIPLAKEFGVSCHAIDAIVSGRNWKHVGQECQEPSTT